MLSRDQYMDQLPALLSRNKIFYQIQLHFASQINYNDDQELQRVTAIFQTDQLCLFLRNFSDHQDIKSWLGSLKTTLRNLYDSQLTILPGSIKKVNC